MASTGEVPVPSMTKKQKGRLKKLRNRTQSPKDGCPKSGLTTRGEFKEYSELVALSALAEQTSSTTPKDGTNVNVLVRRRLSKNTKKQKSEGLDHRDILCNLLPAQRDTKKRPRDEEEHHFATTKLPLWASLHNHGALESVAVIEAYVEGNCDREKLHDKLFPDDMQHHVLEARARWFQGSSPRSITDALFYKSMKITQKDDSKENSTLSQVTTVLSKLALSQEQLTRQGYPSTTEEKDATQRLQTEVQQPGQNSNGLISLDDAKKIVEPLHVLCDNQAYVASLHRLPSGKDESDSSSPLPLIYALDCEMVQTSSGSELARATLLRLTCIEPLTWEVILDELVKPYEAVKDYLTQYSGITAAMMQNVTTRLEQIQAKLLGIICSDDVLVGHSLENDLHACRLIHKTVVDTAVLFQHNGRKYSLRHLSSVLLQEQIQTETGHCSEEDAVATLKLAVRRAVEGPSFRIHEKGRVPWMEYHAPGTTVCIGPSDWVQEHMARHLKSAHVLSYDAIQDVKKAILAWLAGPRRRADLLWSKVTVSDEESLNVLHELLTSLMANVSKRTVILLAVQQGYADSLEEYKRRRACKDRRSTLGWSDDSEDRWRETLDRCRMGDAFWITKK